MIHKLSTLLVLLGAYTLGWAQSAGFYNYDFLNSNFSARSTALGGTTGAMVNSDASLLFSNPGSLNPQMEKELAFSFINHFAGIKMGAFALAHHFKDFGTVGAGVQYIDYGTFVGTDEFGTPTTPFKAKAVAFNFAYSKPLDSNFTIGVAFKPLSSVLETYTSFALATDWGVTYTSDNKLFSSGLVIKNVGFVLNSYNPLGTKDRLPWQIDVGISAQPEHLPLRFNLLIHNLQRWDLGYDDNLPKPLVNEITLDTIDYTRKFIPTALDHVALGAELKMLKKFYLRFGFDFMRNRAMKYENVRSFNGFSWGMGLELKRFTLQYSRSNYFLGNSPHVFTINYRMK